MIMYVYVTDNGDIIAMSTDLDGLKIFAVVRSGGPVAGDQWTRHASGAWCPTRRSYDRAWHDRPSVAGRILEITEGEILT
jgi:hypothetical protein